MLGPRDNDGYTDRELEEIEELNRLPEDHRSLFQNPWWQRIAIGFLRAHRPLAALPGRRSLV